MVGGLNSSILQVSTSPKSTMLSLSRSASALLGFKISLAVLAGLTSHLTIFIRGEWHTTAPTLLVFYLMLCSCYLALETIISSQYDLQYLLILAAHFGSILASMTIYRTMLHRLNGFPGPFLAKITKLWHAAHLFDSKNHLLLGRLHQQYGNFVRTGESCTLHIENP